MQISAKQVMELRQASGMPMMQCKKALQESDGDFEKAMDSLRKLGLKTAEKRSGRATSEGLLAVRISEDRKVGTMVQVLCESEPVKNTPKFVEFVETIADLAHAGAISTREELLTLAWPADSTLAERGATVEETLRNLVGLIGENMQLGKVSHMTVEGDGVAGAYIHNDKKQGALVAIGGSSESLADTAKELCQHIVFAKPAVLNRDDIPAEEIEKELGFLREQISEDPKMQGKPEQAVEGIVQGRLNKNFFAPRVLSEQGWYREDSKKVSAILAERGASVIGFAHFEPGA